MDIIPAATFPLPTALRVVGAALTEGRRAPKE